MEFRDYLRMLRRGWPIVILFTLAAVGLAGSYVTLTPRTYQADALVYVSVQGPRSIGELEQGSQFSASAAKTYASLAESPAVLDRVISALDLTMTTTELSSVVDVSVREDTSLIQITASSDNAVQSAKLANGVAVQVSRSVNRLEESTGLFGVRNFVRLRQVQTADPPPVAVSPNVRRTLALGLIAGLVLGLATTILFQSLDTRIRSPRMLWSLTRLPLVAAIPRVRRSQMGAMIVRDDPSSGVGEAFRTMRTNIRFLETTDEHSLVVAAVAEGRSGVNVAANLAWALADVGYRVVVVDGDLRRPKIADLLDVDSSKGLSDVLAGHLTIGEALVESGHPKLTVLPAGTLPPNPSELLGSPELATIVATLESQFDYVIIDAPPVLSYSDAAVLALGARQTLVTVTGTKTRSAQLSAALGRLENAGTTAMGIVLTQIRNGSNREAFIRPPDARDYDRRSAVPSDASSLTSMSDVRSR